MPCLFKLSYCRRFGRANKNMKISLISFMYICLCVCVFLKVTIENT